MTKDERAWMDSILDKARKEEALTNYNIPSGPLENLLEAVIALEASHEDPVGIDEEDIPEVENMTLRLLEIYTREGRPGLDPIVEMNMRIDQEKRRTK